MDESRRLDQRPGRAGYYLTDAERSSPAETSRYNHREGTAGNTGIGLTILGQAKGYRVVIVIPETQSPEKISLLHSLGAEVITVPEKPYSDPGNYNHIAQRLAQENGWFWANQFDNIANRQAHIETTGPEIWEQTGGQVTAIVASVGTGGTLAGTSIFLKERNPGITVACADPFGAAMWSWFTHSNTNIKDGDSYAEGIGQSRVTKNLEGITVDRAYRIEDQVRASDGCSSSTARGRIVSWPVFRH